MGAAFLTMLFFAATAVLARRAALALGPAMANAARLALAAALLGGWSWSFGYSSAAARPWFLLSGIAGFGVGGLAMFYALPRAGSIVSTLIVQCGSALVAAGFEWAWLGVALAPAQLACAAAVLAGVVIALAPRALPHLPPVQLWSGTALAIFSALGQGAGAVLSRRAFAAARAGVELVDPGTAAFERAVGGLAIALLGWVVAVALAGRIRKSSTPRAGRAWAWVVANALTGPVLGVTCFQWALSAAPAGLVQPIVALAPLVTAPLAWRCGELVPRRRYFAGAALAVLGAGALWWTR